MANWSDTTIRIKGSKEQIIKTDEVIEKFIAEDKYGERWFGFERLEDIYETFPEYKKELDEIDLGSFRAGFSYMEIFTKEVEEYSIYISGAGHWCSPYLFFELLAKKLKLDLEYFDAESGSDFSYLLIMKNGKVIKKEDKGYYSKNTVDYIFAGEITDFLENIEWYFKEEQKEIENIERLLQEYGLSRKKLMQNAA